MNSYLTRGWHCLHLTLFLFSGLMPGMRTVAADADQLAVCQANAGHTALSSWEFYNVQGEPRHIVVTAGQPDPGACDSLALPNRAGKVLWAGPLPDQSDIDLNSRLILQGNFTPGNVTVSEIINSSSQGSARMPSAMGRNLLQDFNTLLFGTEQRATWRDGNSLVCLAGTEVAGLQLQSRLPWSIDMQLQISAFGEGSFTIAIADRPRLEREAVIELGTIALHGATTPERISFPLPENTAPWEALTLLCPPSGGTIHFDTIVLKPAGQHSATNRSAWVWNPVTWLEDPQFFWTLQGLEDINEFYISIPVTGLGTLEQEQALRQFIGAAHTRGVKIWAVIGDRHDVLPQSLPALRTRLSAYREYNRRVPTREQLAGVQLDIEPYLLPGHNLAPDYWRERYLQTLRAARDYAGSDLVLDLVMPVWWGTHPDWSEQLLEGLRMPNISLTIMNYRTRYDQILEGALPFLNWGLARQIPVRIALETGTLGNETQRGYAGVAAAGELWSTAVGSQRVLVLFDNPVAGLPGRAFQQTDERQFNADNLTFAGNQAQLNDVAQRLSAEWQHWVSFTGIALHGLDEVYAN